MHTSSTEFEGRYCLQRRCCFRLSLKTGLIVWGSLKLFIDMILVICGEIVLYQAVSSAEGNVIRLYRDTVIILCVILFMVIIDMAQHLILLIGTFKENLTLLKEYYIFTVIWWIFIAIVGVIGIFFTAKDFRTATLSDYNFEITALCVDVITLTLYLGLQLYISLHVRSAIIEFKNKSLSTENI